MNRQLGARLTRELAIEICQRENVKAVITGSIARVGTQYLLSLEAIDCRDSSVFASERGGSESREGILDVLSQSSSHMRAKLGESLSSIQKFDQPLREVTTSSLEALKAYNSGAQMIREERDEAAAVLLFRRAIELDPDFAMAYSYLAIAEEHLGEVEQAALDQNKAYSLRGRVSERERLLITTGYHWLVTGDMEKELETLEQWKQEYSREYFPHNSLGDIYADYLGQYEKSIEYLKLACQLEPKQPYSPMALAASYLALDKVQEAKKLIDQTLAEGYDALDVHYLLFKTALLQGDTATLDAQRR
jgi:Flp pilus assembly protein TadD